MRVSELHRTNRLVVSFELFPPKDVAAEAKLFEQTVPELKRLSPHFVTCTYGAGGSTREATLRIVERARREADLEVAAHLTCVGASHDELRAYLNEAKACGVDNIVALRGDPPKDDKAFQPHPEGFGLAIDLIRFIRSMNSFDVVAAGYPEGHPECPDRQLDWRRLAQKVEAGASVIITQLFYDNRDFFAMDDYLKNRLGVKVPVVPGILPILSGQQIKRFCGLCRSKLPAEIVARLDSFGDDHHASREYGIELATRMCDELIRYGVPGIHFYTLNRSYSTAKVMKNLGLA